MAKDPIRKRIFTTNDPHQMRIYKELAEEIGFEESVVFLQIEYLISISKNIRDGSYWTFQSLRELRKNYFPWWSITTISRIIKELENQKLLIIGSFNKLKSDQTPWYSINEVGISKLKSIKYEEIKSLIKEEKQSSQLTDKSLSKIETPYPQSIDNPLSSSETPKTQTIDRSLSKSETSLSKFETGVSKSETTLPETTTETTEEKKIHGGLSPARPIKKSGNGNGKAEPLPESESKQSTLAQEYFQVFRAGFYEKYGPAVYHEKATQAEAILFNKTKRDQKEAFDVTRWSIAVKNYFLTPQSSHTFCSLLTRYAVFLKHPLDEYGKPDEARAAKIAASSRPIIDPLNSHGARAAEIDKLEKEKNERIARGEPYGRGIIKTGVKR